MRKINILSKGFSFKWGYNFGYWSLFHYFKKELFDLGYTFNFYNKPSPDFFNCDYIFVNNKYFSENYGIKIVNKFRILKKFYRNEIRYDEIAEKFSRKNQNLIWFDLTDSAGTTQFEVMPYVKKYIKGQIYKNKELYKKKLFRNRHFSDYYQKKFKLEKHTEFNFHVLDSNYKSKLLLGWNLGVGNFFDIIKYNYSQKFICMAKFAFVKEKKELFNYTLKNREPLKKKFDLFFKLSIRKKNEKKSIHFQREYVEDLLKKKYDLDILKKKMSHKKYLLNLMNSKISVGCFGWGEICYREFEATKMGTAFIYPNLDHINTWPNLFIDGLTYKSYNLDFTNLQDSIEFLIENKDVREKMIYNSQKILNDVYSEVGLNYILNFLKRLD